MKKFMQKGLIAFFAFALTLSFTVFSDSASAASSYKYTVKYGDTLWKISQQHQVNLSKLIAANPQIYNPSILFPYQTVYIPTTPTAPSTPSTQPAPTPTPAPAPAPSADSSIAAWEAEVVQLVNVERQKAGLQPLTQDAALTKVARAKSADMRDNNYFSHQSPTYGSPFDMMKQFGISYRTAGENIAAGQTSPKAVVDAWMNSEGHRANILNGNYTKIGVGLVKGGSYNYYWTQMFTG